MKKIILIVGAALALAACEDKLDQSTPLTPSEPIDNEVIVNEDEVRPPVDNPREPDHSHPV